MAVISRKRVIWAILSILGVFASVFLLGMAYIVVQSAKAGVPVLNYHQINDKQRNALTITVKEFDEQMAYLKEAGYTTITPDQLVDYLQSGKALPENPVLITFDDGYEDNYLNAYPILQKYQFTATIFVVTDFMDTNKRYLTWEQVKEMRKNGIYFGSHTLSHQFLNQTSSEEETRFQLAKSKEALEWQLREPIGYLAYPGGFYDNKIIRLTKEAGYRGAFTIDLGRGDPSCGAYRINRIPIFAGTHSFWRFWFRLKFTPAVIGLEEVKERVTHWGIPGLARCIIVP